MANRNTLSVGNLDKFKEWLISDGWRLHNPKGIYEVLRATKDGKPLPLIVYKRNDTNNGNVLVHYTVADRDMGVVRAFLKAERMLKEAKDNYEEWSGLKQAKQDVAREIFAEINAIKKEYASGDIDGNELYLRLYMLEKKYTEGK